MKPDALNAQIPVSEFVTAAVVNLRRRRRRRMIGKVWIRLAKRIFNELSGSKLFLLKT